VTRYVLLRIEDDAQAATLIEDMAEWQDSDLLTPCQENTVHAEIVSATDRGNPRAIFDAIERSHHEHQAQVDIARGESRRDREAEGFDRHGVSGYEL
jgi:hypothetical protein